MKIYSPTITGSAANTNIVTTTRITSLSALSASFASTASYVQNAVSSSYGATSSYANSFTVGGTLTAQTLVVQTITSSVEFVTGSSVNGSLSSNTHQFTGSVLVTGSGTFTSKLSINNPVSPYANGITVGGTGTGIMMYSTSTGNQTSIQIINASNYNYGTIGVVSGTGNIGGDVYGLGYTGNSNSTFTPVLSWTSTGSVSIGTTVSKATLQVSSILTGVPSIPSLGSTNGYVTTYFTNPNSLYGLLGGSLNNGDYWMQVQRTDGTATAYNLVLQSNGGQVLIGTTDATGGGNLVIGGTSSNARVLPATDNVGYIGQSDKRWQAIYAVNGSIVTSDRTEKKNIVETDLGLQFIEQLRPVSYSWIQEDGKKHYGLIAQEIEELGYEFGGLDISNGRYGLAYTEFISPMIKAIQELKAEIDTLKQQQ